MRQGKDKNIKALDDLYDLIWVDTERAWKEALHIHGRNKGSRLTYSSAKVQMIVFIIATITSNSGRHPIDADVLKAYFEKHNHRSEAATTLLWMMRANIMAGKAEKLLVLDREFEEKYAAAATPEDLVSRMLATSNYHMMRDLNKANQVELALKAEALLRAHPKQTAKYRVSLANMLQHKAEALSQIGDTIAAQKAMDEAIALVDMPGTSPYYSFVCHYFKGNVAAIAGQNEVALKSYYLLADKFGGNSFYDRLLMYVYIQTFKMLNEQCSKARPPEQKKLVLEQQKYLDLAKSLLPTQKRPYIMHYIDLSEARLMRVLHRYDAAITLLARALRYFSSISYSNHVIDIWEEAYQNYRNRAEKTQSPAHYRKAMWTLSKVTDLNHKYNQAQGKEKMDALINKYELQQKELNEQLLHQKMEAMNKEMQMTALNLQEKVTVLDELKGYVTSLKKKGKETNDLIRAISRKIDSVIITEQDKSTLQQKISEASGDLVSILSDRYPELSMLEIRMCTLLKTGMTNKELSKLYGQSEKSYEQHRYRIKKKMGLGRDEKLIRALNQIAAK